MLDVIGILARFVLAAILVWAGVSKLRASDAMAPVPARLAALATGGFSRALGFAIALTEITLGILLISGAAGIWVGLATAMMLVAFTSYLIVANLGRHEVTCACFGRTHTTARWRAIARNFVLILLALGSALVSSGLLA